MKIIRCTQKMLHELQVDPLECVEPTNWLESWHANVFTIERRKCVLVSNDATLYSMLFLGLKKSDFSDFQFLLNETFFKSMLGDGLPQNLIERGLNVGDEVVYTKSTDRRVQGSMNRVILCLKYIIVMNEDCDNPTFLSQNSINEMPCGMYGYKIPKEFFVEKLREGNCS